MWVVWWSEPDWDVGCPYKSFDRYNIGGIQSIRLWAWDIRGATATTPPWGNNAYSISIGAEVTDGYITGEVTEIIPEWFDEDPGFVVRLVADMTFEDVDLEGRSVTTTTVKKGEKVIRGENELQVVS